MLRIALIAAALCPLPLLYRAFVKAKSATTNRSFSAAQLSEQVTLRAVAGRDPTVNLSDGHNLLTSYAGPDDLRVALEQDQAAPLSLASADFDEDGVPDLVSGYSYNGQGIVTLLRGNVDSIYPNAPAAQQRKANGTFTNAPFLAPAIAISAPVAADFLGAGDFDADGHWDLAISARSSDTIYLLAGDGHGGFALTRQVELPGRVTSMTTGEINRRDGLDDIVVGVTGSQGSFVLVFEGPEGALRSDAESWSMPAPVTVLQLGQFDGDYAMDLAVAAGDDLVVVRGRDRKLSLDPEQQQKVSPLRIETRTYEAPIESLVSGDFSGTGQDELAVLTTDGRLQVVAPNQPTRQLQVYDLTQRTLDRDKPRTLVRTDTSANTADDLMLIDNATHQVETLTRPASETAQPGMLELTSAPVAILPMRLNGDALNDLVVLGSGASTITVVETQPEATFIVTNTNDSGAGSLRNAINASFGQPNSTIIFQIPLSDPGPRDSGAFVIKLTSSLSALEANGTVIDATTQTAFAGDTNPNGPEVELNGSLAGSSLGMNIRGSNCVVRGLVINAFGIDAVGISSAAFTSGSKVEGCYLGTNASGTAAVANAHFGVLIGATSNNNTVGGSSVAARNVISGNNQHGIGVGQASSGNTVQGNYVGTNAAGSAAIPNGPTNNNGVGIFIGSGSQNNVIGGTAAGAGNLVSGNPQIGVYLSETGTASNLVQGNFIGTDKTGTVSLGNKLGVSIINSNSNTIGGTTASARNVISGNFGTEAGIAVYGGPTSQGPGESKDNLIQGNFIGTNSAGTARVQNNGEGVRVTITSGSAVNTIGGAVTSARNLISGNDRNGIAIGIRLIDPASGQPLPGSGGTGITVQNNLIGTDVGGLSCLGNTLNGIIVDADSTTNTIRDNVISCNGQSGVFLPDSNNPAIRIFIDNNSIFSNAVLGIDLGVPGINANDFKDPDVGPNLLQNYPELTSFGPPPPANEGKTGDLTTDAITVNATLNSTPNTSFTIHWYFSTDAQCVMNQQASRPLVTGKVSDVITNGNGDAQFFFHLDFPAGVTNGIVNCTATDPQNNTSEFSACLVVTDIGPPAATVKFDAASYSAAENVGSKQVTVTRTGSTASACSVNYTTSDTAGASPCNSLNTGIASSRCDYEMTLGTLKFAAGEVSKTISLPIIDDAYNEGNENFTIALSNPVNVSLDAQSSAVVTIVDDSTPSTNPISDGNFFVKMHYYDFLNREADTPGLNFWRDQITSCGSDAGCTEVRRINVSASFFLSIEFQQTGYLVERTYKVSFGDIDKNSNFPQPTHTIKVPIIRFTEFLADTQQITQGVVVLAPGWEQQLENNKAAFFNEFVQRSRFTTALPTTMTPAQFVDALNTNAGNVLSANEKTTAINLFGGAGNTANTTARAQALRQVAEDADLNTAEFNRAFVLMQYFGYLRRNPDDPQDTDYSGYEFWLIKLNQFGGNYINAEMVKAFLSSIEYNRRFGPS